MATKAVNHPNWNGINPPPREFATAILEIFSSIHPKKHRQCHKKLGTVLPRQYRPEVLERRKKRKDAIAAKREFIDK